MYQIKNDIFCLDISETGAELDKLCIHNINILWEKGALWNSQSPILFPFIGRTKDGYYIYENQRYDIPIHGFLKEQIFDAVIENPNCIRLTQKFNENTLKMYPFKYEFNIIYQLIDDKIRIILQVKNMDDKEMYFACGLHPGFSYNGLKKLMGEDLKLFFNPQQVKFVSFDPSLVKDMQEITLKSVMTLEELSKELAVHKTLCYQGLTSIELRSQAKALKIISQMPYTAFWQSVPENPEFICVEPWYGLPDEYDSNHQLKDKKYCQVLKPNKTFEASIEISIKEEVKI